MATVGMKYALVCGARDMRGTALEVLLDLGALELHRLSAVTGGRAQRQALIRLYEQVRDCGALDVPLQCPEAVPDDLVALAEQLLADTDGLFRELNELLAIDERQQVWGEISPGHLTDLAEEGIHVQCWRTDDPQSLAWLDSEGTVLWQGRHPQNAREMLFYTLRRGEPLALDWAVNLALPDRDPASLHTQISHLRARIETLQGGLRWLARERIDEFGRQVAERIDELSIESGRIQSHADEHVFVLSGWIPADQVDACAQRLRQLSFHQCW